MFGLAPGSNVERNLILVLGPENSGPTEKAISIL